MSDPTVVAGTFEEALAELIKHFLREGMSPDEIDDALEDADVAALRDSLTGEPETDDAA